MAFSESEVIAELASIFSSTDSRIRVGIGDDAAVVAPAVHDAVITTDMAIENVHFKRSWSSAFEIGAKITAANLETEACKQWEARVACAKLLFDRGDMERCQKMINEANAYAK